MDCVAASMGVRTVRASLFCWHRHRVSGYIPVAQFRIPAVQAVYCLFRLVAERSTPGLQSQTVPHSEKLLKSSNGPSTDLARSPGVRWATQINRKKPRIGYGDRMMYADVFPFGGWMLVMCYLSGSCRGAIASLQADSHAQHPKTRSG